MLLIRPVCAVLFNTFHTWKNKNSNQWYQTSSINDPLEHFTISLEFAVKLLPKHLKNFFHWFLDKIVSIIVRVVARVPTNFVPNSIVFNNGYSTLKNKSINFNISHTMMNIIIIMYVWYEGDTYCYDSRGKRGIISVACSQHQDRCHSFSVQERNKAENKNIVCITQNAAIHSELPTHSV